MSDRILGALALVTAGFAAGGCATLGDGGTVAGRLDASIVRAAATYPGSDEVELECDASGGLRTLSFQHQAADKIPESVQKLVLQKLPGAVLRAWESEVLTDGTRIFEAHALTPDHKECELSATESGAFRYVECLLPPAELPAAVKKAVDELLPGAQLVEAEHQLGGESEVWSVEARAPSGLWYFHVTTEGCVLDRARVIPARLRVLVQ